MTGTVRCHCEGALFATEAISNPAGRWLRFVRLTKYGQDLQDKQDCFYGAAVELPLAVIARECSLRPKQSPIRQGDGFTSYAITKYGHDLQDKQDCFYGVVFVLPLAVIARERSLRPKQSPIRQGDGFVSLAMTGTARCHCEGALFVTEAISNPAWRWLRFTRHDRHRQVSLRGSIICDRSNLQSGREMASFHSP
jgi:hypothetical protein